jgi:CHAD domain-containing protein
LKRRESIDEGIRRIAREQIDEALRELDDRELDGARKVHQVRKRCKKLRGLVRLVRPALGKIYRAENARYRDAARQLSRARDARTQLVAFDQLVAHFGGEMRPDAFAPLRQRLIDRTDPELDQDPTQPLRVFSASFREGRGHVEGWALSESGFDAIAHGLQMTYRRGREAMAEAYACPTPEAFHEWRKRVKYHGYHLQLLKPLWPSVLKEQRAAVDRLGEYLGEDHDLAVLREALADGREAGKAGSPLEAFLALLDRRRIEFQSWARPLGERVYAEKPKALVDRFGAYWQAWR